MSNRRRIRTLLLQDFEIGSQLYFYYKFYQRNRYLPRINKPRTFNEKINFRKKYWSNPLFVTCSDKLAAKEYVARVVSEKIVIPTIHEMENVVPTVVRKFILHHGDCYLKANHNSGPVYLLSQNSSDSDLVKACEDVNRQLAIDFGKYQREPWYSRITPRAFLEPSIERYGDEYSFTDYKFHVFKQKDGSQRVIVDVHFDQRTDHNRSFFTEELRWIPFSLNYPCLHTQIARPANYEQMLVIAKNLAEPFSYVRVDLYNVDGRIFFGELTFANGSGASPFSAYSYDLWMGRLWHGDPAT